MVTDPVVEVVSVTAPVAVISTAPVIELDLVTDPVVVVNAVTAPVVVDFVIVPEVEIQVPSDSVVVDLDTDSIVLVDSVSFPVVVVEIPTAPRVKVKVVLDFVTISGKVNARLRQG